MRELVALLLLALLVAGAAANVAYLDNIVDEVTALIDLAEEQAAAGNASEAGENVLRAAKHWESKSHYTHILLRHTEIDSCTDAFYDLYTEVSDGEYPTARGAFEKVRAHLHEISTMEHISFGSIF